MERNRTSFTYKVQRKILRLYQQKVLGLFDSVLIETFGGCNRSCSFCFQSEVFDKRKQGQLHIDTIKKGILELKEFNFAGRVSFHFFGEPLLDKRIVNIIAITRDALPFAQLRFSTNGDHLTEGKLKELIDAGVDKLSVTNYDDVPNMKLEELSENYSKYIIYRGLRADSENIRSRSDMNIKTENAKKNDPCFRPSNQLVLNWEGNSVLCCNDFYKKHSFGNLKLSTIKEIWFNKEFSKMRSVLKKNKGRQEYDFCKNCDV